MALLHFFDYLSWVIDRFCAKLRAQYRARRPRCSPTAQRVHAAAYQHEAPVFNKLVVVATCALRSNLLISVATSRKCNGEPCFLTAK